MEHSATYSPEDDKLRLYPACRLGQETYARVKAAGFKWAPKQELFVAVWSPGREDLLLELCGEIDDEDYSPEERSADRAERFSGYRDKRAAEAGAKADTFDAGPSAFGHQSRQRAERQAARHDRYRVGAVSQWSKAEYWQQRTAGVIRHALHKSSAAVRRGRILTLEAELRKLVASYTPTDDPPHVIMQAAYDYSSGKYLHDGAKVPHVWVGPQGRGGRWVEQAYLPTIEAASRRWREHLELRLEYERAMLDAEGGTAAEAEIEPGGWICTGARTGSAFYKVETGWKQVQAVNKSPATGRVVSVKVWGTSSGYTPESGYKEYATKPALVLVNIERLPEGAYRPPTDEERAEFAKATKERKAKAKADKPKAPPLVNPTDDDAERLQAVWNAKAREGFEESKREGRAWGDFQASTVIRMTQAEYSAISKGSYAKAETVDVCENGHLPRRWDNYKEAKNPPIAFKVRKTWGNAPGGWMGKAASVIVLTDKPQKPIPLDWEAVMGGELATV